MSGDDYVFVHATLNGSIRRTFELPRSHDDADRKTFVKWLLDVTPDADQRQQGAHLELHREEWSR